MVHLCHRIITHTGTDMRRKQCERRGCQASLQAGSGSCLHTEGANECAVVQKRSSRYLRPQDASGQPTEAQQETVAACCFLQITADLSRIRTTERDLSLGAAAGGCVQ